MTDPTTPQAASYWQNQTPWSNQGYQDMLQVDRSTTLPGATPDNPWGQTNLEGLKAAYQAKASAYPTYPNSAGLGTQTAFSGGSPAPSSPPPSAPSAGMQSGPMNPGGAINPWMLFGESNAR